MKDVKKSRQNCAGENRLSPGQLINKTCSGCEKLHCKIPLDAIEYYRGTLLDGIYYNCDACHSTQFIPKEEAA